MGQIEDRYISLLTDFGFKRIFGTAEIARFTPRELCEYEDSRKAYRDLKNSLDTALRQGRAEGHAKGLEEGLVKGHAKGLEEGRAEEKMEMAKNLKSLGVDVKTIMKASGLTEEQIEQLRCASVLMMKERNDTLFPLMD